MPAERRKPRVPGDALFWAPHETEAWLPGYVKNDSGEKVTLVVEGGNVDKEELVFSKSQVQEFFAVLPEHEAGVDDVCSLPSVPEGALLHTVRVRYRRSEIYTRVARTVIAVNPFCSLPIYSSQCVDQYMAAVDSMDLPPHIFGLSKDALQGLQTNSRNQAVLISGESGAGKTESAKLILSFVADAVRGSQKKGEGITEKVLLTNPVMEAFGNAMTVRNNNSSRFGKWLDLAFDGVGARNLTGCRLTSYLLETTRVCTQASDERGFHVFFQLLQARSSPLIAGLALKDPTHYRYTKGGRPTAPGIDDSQCFDELCEALTTVGFSQEARAEVFRIVAGILELGNLEFDSKSPDQAKLVSDEATEAAAKHFGVPIGSLKECVLVRKLRVGKDVTNAPLRLEQAEAARDALARLLYGRLFLHLIGEMNETLQTSQQRTGSERLLGILDIAGFESFETNSLEQLMINLSNENLQQHFNKVVVKDELRECETENVPVPEGLSFTDNADSVTLIDGKGGILDLLDETMGMPKSTNQSFVTYVLKQHKDHHRVITSKIARLGFGIAHYAGDVFYSCDGWLEKNANNPPSAAIEMMEKSSMACFKKILEVLKAEQDEVSSGSAPGKAKAKTKSATMLFRVSLRSLGAKISDADSHFMRCVKPNKEKVPGKLVGKMVMEQLLLSGVLATVHIRQKGYAHRIPYANFYTEYRCISSRPIRYFKDGQDTELRTEVEALLTEFGGGQFPTGAFALGNTKVFGKSEAIRALDTARREAETKRVLVMQRYARGRKARKRTKVLNEVRNEIRDFIASHRIDTQGIDIGGRKRIDSGATRQANSSASSQGRPRSRTRRLSMWMGGSTLAQLGSQQALKDCIAELDKLLAKAASAGMDNSCVLAAERARLRMRRELEVAEALDDPKIHKSVDPISIDKVLARARGLALPRAGAMEALEDRIESLRTQLPLVQALKQALAQDAAAGPPKAAAGVSISESHPHLCEVTEALEEAELTDPNAWLPELEGAKLAADVARRMADAEAAKAAADAAAAAEAAAAEEAALRAEEAAREAATEAAAKAAAEAQAKEATQRAQAEADQQQEVVKKETEKMEAEKREAEKRELEKKEAERREAEKVAERKSVRSSTSSQVQDSPAKEPASSRASTATAIEVVAQTPIRELSDFLDAGATGSVAVPQAEQEKEKEKEVCRTATAKQREMRQAVLAPFKSAVKKAGMQKEFLTKVNNGREVEKLRAAMLKAADEYDAEGLEALLRQAEKLGLRAVENGALVAARQAFENLQAVDFVVATLEATEREALEPEVPLGTLRRLENLARQLKTMSGYEAEVQEANSILQGALVQRYKSSGRRSVFLSPDPEEVKLGNSTFSALSQYSGLKTAKAWPGHRPSTCNGNELRTALSREELGIKTMLRYSKVCIAGALTRPTAGMDEADYEAGAVQNFRNILVCMGDRPAQSCQREASRQAILAVARLEPGLRTEVYLQVLKQVSGNPNPRSVRLGWDLLHSLCLDAPPPPEVAEFVRAAFRDAAADSDGESASMASACRALLDRPEAKLKLRGTGPQDHHISLETAERMSAVEMFSSERMRQAAEIRQLKEEMVRLRSTTTRKGGASIWSQFCMCGDR